MELEGFGIDVSTLEEIGREFDARNEALTRAILAYAPEGMQLNINSTRQLGELLFDILGLPPVKKTKTGYSTDIEVLEKLKNKHPILPLLIEQRKLAKINSTYVKGLTKIVSPDHKIHSSFNQTITTTGRISSSNPNLQNIPIKTEEGRQIRKAFVPAQKDNLLVSADYSQIELRVLAHITKDAQMTQAFIDGKDIHTITASEVFNVAPEDVTPLQRSQAKAVNFGIIYGISDFGLSRNLDIPRKAAAAYIEKYLEEFSGVKAYMAKIIEYAKAYGYVCTLFGRRRYLPDIYSANYTIRSFAERTALNTPIQGTAADIIKIAMVNVAEKLKTGGYRSKMTLQVHDELILDCPQNEIGEVSEMLKYEMEHAVSFDVPIIANIAVGRDWYNAK
jgi:DNA polymerase-1